MITSVLKTEIKKDLYRYCRSVTLRSFVRQFLFNPAFRFMAVSRFCKHTSSINPFGIFFRLYFRRLRVKFGYQIPFSTSIGSGFQIGHFGNIVVNSKAKIGENCNVAQGVTIGQINIGEKKGCPVIGNRVWVGANAVVVGNIKIGDDVLIAPLAFVNFDVPDNALVIGNPARIIPDKGSAGYVNNLHEG